MTLTQEQQDMLREHFRDNSISRCPLCGQNRWALEETLTYSGVYDPEYQQPVQGKFYPAVAATCENCYYIATFSAVRLGIVNQ